MDWNYEHVGILTGLHESEVALLTAIGTADGWNFEVRGDDRDAIADFHEYLRARNVAITIYGIHALLEPEVGLGLTEAQEKALRIAYERGYYDDPRRASLGEIAEDLDISRQALAGRLRRGYKRVLESTLLES